jgi:hypothetical protein
MLTLSIPDALLFWDIFEVFSRPALFISWNSLTWIISVWSSLLHWSETLLFVLFSWCPWYQIYSVYLLYNFLDFWTLSNCIVELL